MSCKTKVLCQRLHGTRHSFFHPKWDGLSQSTPLKCATYPSRCRCSFPDWACGIVCIWQEAHKWANGKSPQDVFPLWSLYSLATLPPNPPLDHIGSGNKRIWATKGSGPAQYNIVHLIFNAQRTDRSKYTHVTGAQFGYSQNIMGHGLIPKKS